MEINIEQLKTVTPEATKKLNALMLQLNPNSRSLNQNEIEKIIKETSNQILVAKDCVNHKIIGMLTLVTINSFTCKKGVLEDLVVDKNYQGKGIGTKLILSAISKAREERIVRLDFTSSPERAAANRLYQHLGFNKRNTNMYRIEL